MGAYHRRRGEDRVTEVLATVLNSAPSYVGQLADRLGLRRQSSYRIETQVGVSGSVVDLEIEALGPAGETAWLLWSEHKVGAPFADQQLTRYASALGAKAGSVESRLIAVTQHPPSDRVRAEAADLGVELLRWREVVALSARAGAEIGGSAWKLRPQYGDDEIARRLLLEWDVFCRHRLEEIIVEPLTDRHVEVLRDMKGALQTTDHLLRTGFRAACEAIGAGSPVEKPDDYSAPPPPSSWLKQGGATLQMYADTDDSWTSAPVGLPFVAAGIWVEREDARALRDRSELLQALDGHGFSFWDEPDRHGGYLDVVRTVPMAALVAHPLLADQERLLAEFGERAFRDLLESVEDALEDRSGP